MGMRERVLDAAEQVLRTKGLVGATTKEIARAAGCSEGTLYNHFPSKEAVFVAVLAERLPPFVPLLAKLVEGAGTGDVGRNLEEVARSALAFFAELLPITAAALGTPGVREELRRSGVGPHRANEALASYLRLEQRLGRLHPAASPEAAAALLLGACQQRAVHASFLGEDGPGAPDGRFVEDLVGTLVRGLRPPEGEPGPSAGGAA